MYDSSNPPDPIARALPGIPAADGWSPDMLVNIAKEGLYASDEVAEHEPFLQWLAAEERRRARNDGQAGQAGKRQERLARRIQAAAAARQCRVLCLSGQPSLHAEHGRGDTHGGRAEGRVVRRARRVDLGVAAGIGRELWDEPCETWIDLPPGVSPGEYIGLGVSGDSMEPLMHTGDTILVRIGTELQADTVIVARHPDNGYVVKRVARLTNTTVHLASLNAGYPLLALPRDPALIVGTVVMRWCAHDEGGTSSGGCPQGTSGT